MARGTVLDPRARDLTGKPFGKLTAIRPTDERLRTYVVWECRCECGTILNVSAKYLVGRQKNHCGCLNNKRAVVNGREYRIWCDLRNRCNNPNNKRYPRYGARGIRVCDRWEDFSLFRSDMGPCPIGMSIDRVDNDRDYEPGNCHWTTSKQQGRNTSRNRLLTLGDKTMCLADWAIDTGISCDTIGSRMDFLGWDVRRALTTPIEFHRGRSKPRG